MCLAVCQHGLMMQVHPGASRTEENSHQLYTEMRYDWPHALCTVNTNQTLKHYLSFSLVKLLLSPREAAEVAVKLNMEDYTRTVCGFLGDHTNNTAESKDSTSPSCLLIFFMIH